MLDVSPPTIYGVVMSEKTKSRLGRGLSSLLSMEIPAAALEQLEPAPPSPSPAAENQPGRSWVRDLPVDAVSVNPHQPRRVFDESSLTSLATSMAAAGVIQPVVVRQKEDGTFELIAGERRLRAARLAGLETIPAIVREADRVAQAQLALIENTQRQDLNPIERAAAYRTLQSQLGLTQAQLAERLGEDRSGIANYLRLLDLPLKIQEFLQAGRLSLGHAKVLASIEDASQAELIGIRAAEGEWSVRALENAMRTEPELRKAKDPATLAHLRETEESISRSIGMKVKLKSAKKGAGRLTIQYSSLKQFDELMERLGVDLSSM